LLSVQLPNVNLKSIIVRPIKSNERDEWDHLMATNHYLGFKHLVVGGAMVWYTRTQTPHYPSLPIKG